jgi:hypothetical protein
MIESVVFYAEWLPLPKAEFNILAMLAEQGSSFTGNYTDMCRYLGVTPQNRNRQTIRRSIESLSSKGFLNWESRGRTQILSIVPKGTEVELDNEWVRSVIKHDYSSESVAWAQVLKVFVWVSLHCDELIQNDMIAQDLECSVSTIVSAKNVLQREYENITKEPVSTKVGENRFRTLGQKLAANAWWTKI